MSTGLTFAAAATAPAGIRPPAALLIGVAGGPVGITAVITTATAIAVLGVLTAAHRRILTHGSFAAGPVIPAGARLALLPQPAVSP